MFIEGKHIYFKYDKNKKSTIVDFSMTLEKGEILAILGESGSGKSTILRILAGLEKPYKGELKIGEVKMFSKSSYKEPEDRGIGMVFQDYALFPHITVKKNIQYGLKGKTKAEKAAITEEMLTLVNLIEYKDKYPYELSGGQQQRVAIARAIAPKPSVLLLDEPFSNLDENLQSRIRDEIKEILKKAAITSIFVTHHKDDARKIADKVIVLKDGVIVGSSSAKDERIYSL